MQDKTVNVHVNTYDTTYRKTVTLPSGGSATMSAGGFNSIVNSPTNFTAGEAGPERVTVQPITNHNYGGMTVNTAATSDTYGQDFALLQALAQ